MDENFQNVNKPNEMYDDLNNNPKPNYIPPQMTNDGYFNSPNNNIYSAVQPNNNTQTNIYSQNMGRFYYQNNININTQSQNNDESIENYNPPPPIYPSQSNEYFNPGYTPHTNEINQEYIPNIVEGTNPTYSPQIISDNNNGFTSQVNDDVPTKKILLQYILLITLITLCQILLQNL